MADEPAGNPILRPYGIPDGNECEIAYAVVAAPDVQSLAQAVTQLCAQGYFPHGSVAVDCARDARVVSQQPKFFQAMLKLTDKGHKSLLHTMADA